MEILKLYSMKIQSVEISSLQYYKDCYGVNGYMYNTDDIVNSFGEMCKEKYNQ